MGYKIILTKRAQKDAAKIELAGLKSKALSILAQMKENPFVNPPPYEKLIGDLAGMYSRRVNIQHRLVYAVHEDTKIIRVLSMWSRYE